MQPTFSRFLATAQRDFPIVRFFDVLFASVHVPVPCYFKQYKLDRGVRNVAKNAYEIRNLHTFTKDSGIQIGFS